MFPQLGGMLGSGGALEDLQARAELHSPRKVTDSPFYDAYPRGGGRPEPLPL